MAAGDCRRFSALPFTRRVMTESLTRSTGLGDREGSARRCSRRIRVPAGAGPIGRTLHRDPRFFQNPAVFGRRWLDDRQAGRPKMAHPVRWWADRASVKVLRGWNVLVSRRLRSVGGSRSRTAINRSSRNRNYAASAAERAHGAARSGRYNRRAACQPVSRFSESRHRVTQAGASSRPGSPPANSRRRPSARFLRSMQGARDLVVREDDPDAVVMATECRVGILLPMTITRGIHRFNPCRFARTPPTRPWAISARASTASSPPIRANHNG